MPNASNDLNRVTGILGAGTFANSVLPRLRIELDQIGATPSVLFMGVAEFNRQTFKDTHFRQDGVHDVSPRRVDIQQAIGNSNDDEIALRNRDLWEPVIARMSHQIERVMTEVRLRDAQIAWYQAMRSGHNEVAAALLHEMVERNPRLQVTAVTNLPNDSFKRERLRTGNDLFVQLKDNGVISNTFVIDNDGPFARTYNLETLDRFTNKAIASILRAQSFAIQSPSFVETGRALGEYSYYAGFSFSSRTLVTVPSFPIWEYVRQRWVDPYPAPQAVDIHNTVRQAVLGAEEAVTDRHARAIDEPVDTAKPFYLIFTVPVTPRDREGWVLFSTEVRRQIANAYNGRATCIFAPGFGAAKPTLPHHPYWLQVAALFPLPKVLRPIRELRMTEDQALRLDAPSSNGHDAQGMTGIEPVPEIVRS